jgi:peroxiredoxin
MKLRSGCAAAASAAVLLLAGCAGTDAVDQGGGDFRFHSANSKGSLIAVGQRKPADNFDGTLLNGGKYRLSQDKGKVVVVNFWATWCGPCTVETPQFNTIYNDYKRKPVTFVGIDTKETSTDAAKAFVKDNSIDYPIVYDEQGETAVRLGNIPTQGMPFTVVIDRSHRVAAVYVGRVSPLDLEPVLNTLAAER